MSRELHALIAAAGISGFTDREKIYFRYAEKLFGVDLVSCRTMA